MRGMCLNWKVIGGLGVVALGVVVLAPHLALAVLPILVVAACSLSCIFMMRGMGKGSSCQTNAGSTASQDARITQLQAEIQRLREPQGGGVSTVDEPVESGCRLPVA